MDILRGLDKGISFFNWAFIVAKNLALSMAVISVFIFWIFVYMLYEPFRPFAEVMVRLFQLSILTIAFSLVFKLFLEQTYLAIFKKKLKEIEIKSGNQKRGKRK